MFHSQQNPVLTHFKISASTKFLHPRMFSLIPDRPNGRNWFRRQFLERRKFFSTELSGSDIRVTVPQGKAISASGHSTTDSTFVSHLHVLTV